MAISAPASIPGKNPAATAAPGNLSQLPAAAGFEESMPAGAVAVADGEMVLVEAGADVFVPFCRKPTLESISSRQLLLAQLYPNGQQLSPHLDKLAVRFVVCMTASGCVIGSCSVMAQVIGWIALQSNPTGQQMAESPLFSEIQLVPEAQQIFPGSRESTFEHEVAVELAHVKARASKTPSACAADRADDRAIVAGTELEIRHMRLSLCSILFGEIVGLLL
jgi:hypothetical protein